MYGDEELKRFWRRGGDSNPRCPCRHAAFRVRCDRPLCHLSQARIRRTARPHQARAWSARRGLQARVVYAMSELCASAGTLAASVQTQFVEGDCRCRDASSTDGLLVEAAARTGRTTVTVHSASAATLAETLPRIDRINEFRRAPMTTWSTRFASMNSRIVRGRIYFFEHMHGEAPFVEAQRLRPSFQRHQAIDMLVVPIVVECRIDRDPPELQYVDACEPR